jgi:uncharacterized protein
VSGESLQILSSADLDAIAPEVPWDFAGFEKLLAAVDGKNAKQAAALAGQIACKAGCHHCCRRIPTILPLEWAWIRRSGAVADGQNPTSVRLRSDLNPGESLCGHLDDQGLCTIYGARPLICRTHGSLILSEEGLDHCPWNFQGLEEVDEDMVFRLENLHETLLRLNLAFLQRSYPTRWRELSAIRVEFQA